MLGSPLFESYRREIRRELLRRWAVRLVPVIGVGSVLALGWIYHRSTNPEPAPQSWLPQSVQPVAIPAVQEAPALPEATTATASSASDLAASMAGAASGVDPLLGPAESSSGVAAVPQAPPTLPTHVSGEFQANERLLDLLLAQGVRRQEADQMLRELRTIFDPRRLRPGQKYEFWRSLDGHLDRFLLQTSQLSTFEVVQEGGRFVARFKEAVQRTEMVRIFTTIETSVGAALARAGEKPGLAILLRDFFASDIDFQVHTRKGDQLKIIVEKVLIDDRFVRYGKILAAEYRGSVARVRGFAFVDPEGKSGVYDEQGRSRQIMFLRSPVPGHRITSGLSSSRLHPVLKRYMPHNGVDYRTRTGTPVQAAADGQIQFYGTKGYNGQLLVLTHGSGYKTYYGHLSRLARGLAVGQKVKRGQVVAYTGNTGLSTAPHLHYGISRDGRYLNPAKPPAERAPDIPSGSMKEFLAIVAPLSRDLDHMGPGNEALLGDLLISPPGR